jgi:hypothetical protein
MNPVELDTLAQAIAEAETRAGRERTEDAVLAVARLTLPLGFDPLVIQHGVPRFLDFAFAAYAAGRASADARVAELEALEADIDARIARLEAALKPLAEQSTSEEWMAGTGASFEDINSCKSADWHAGYDAAICMARASTATPVDGADLARREGFGPKGGV